MKRMKKKFLPKIEFVFDKKNYAIDGEAFANDKMALPDGRVLDVIWSDSEPPEPEELRVYGLTLEKLRSFCPDVAESIIVAEEIK